jgi:hypothetical protein
VTVVRSPESAVTVVRSPESASAQRIDFEAQARPDMSQAWQALGGVRSDLQP